MYTTEALDNYYSFKLIDWKELFSNIIFHSGRTNINGGHFDLLNRSGLGLYHYHHGLEPHLHPCEFGVVYYNLEEPVYKTKRKIGYATLKDSNDVNYFLTKQVLSHLPMTIFSENNKKLLIDATQRYARSSDLGEVKYRPIQITIDYSTVENESWLPQSTIKIFDSINWSILYLDLNLYVKDGELHISIDDAMKIINLDNYFKRVTLDSKNCYRFEVTTQTHEEINKMEKIYSVSDAPIWTFWSFAVWRRQNIIPGSQTSDEYVHNFKIEWIQHYKDVIKAAAAEYNIPPFLLAGVMYVEVAGQPPIADPLTYYLRDTFMPNVLEGIANIAAIAAGSARRLPGEAIATSFGDISMQIRVAAEILDYPTPNHLCKEEVYAIIDSLKVPEIGLFMCAKHLLNLKNVDFPHLTLEQLTNEHIRIISTRYNRGAARPLEDIQNGDTSYPDRIMANELAIVNALL